MRGLSIRHPWAWAIVHAGKRIENRSQYFDYRGPVFIHASKIRVPKTTKVPSWFLDEWREMKRILLRAGVDIKSLPSVSFSSLAAKSGGIIGQARIVDCILVDGMAVGPQKKRHPLANDPWYTGEYGLVLQDVRPLPFVPYRGALGLWYVKPNALATIERLQRGSND